jgi:hypothetical protein
MRTLTRTACPTLPCTGTGVLPVDYWSARSLQPNYWSPSLWPVDDHEYEELLNINTPAKERIEQRRRARQRTLTPRNNSR